MNGDQVFMFYNAGNSIKHAILSSKSPNTDIAHVMLVLKAVGTETNLILGRVMGKPFFNNAHYVFGLDWNVTNNEEFAVSFLLAMDHGLDLTAKLFIIDADSKMLLYSVSLRSQPMQRQVVVNPKPSSRLTPLIPPNPPYVLRCQETEEEFRVVINPRKIKLQSCKGILFLPFKIVYFSFLIIKYFCIRLCHLHRLWVCNSSIGSKTAHRPPD